MCTTASSRSITAMLRINRAHWLPFMLLVPGLLLVAGVQVYPALFTICLSFHSIEPGSGQYVFRGFDNFQRLLRNSLFFENLGQRAVFLLGYVVLTLVGAVAIALLLSRQLQL